MDLTAFFKLSYGLYVVSSKKGEKLNGQIANAVFQVTAEPPLIAISINKQNLTCEFINDSKVFSISVLSKETPMQFIGKFGFKSGREIDKFSDIKFKIGKTGAPIATENAIAYFEANVVKTIDTGSTHTIFIGEIVDAGNIEKGEPMTYAYYHEIKRGKSPKTAPTYIKEEKKKEDNKVKKYVCTVCGYVYDPEVGDPDNGIAPGTSFEELPEDWVCPVCGVGKDSFEEEG